MGEQAPEIREVFKYETAFQGDRDREETLFTPGGFSTCLTAFSRAVRILSQ